MKAPTELKKEQGCAIVIWGVCKMSDRLNDEQSCAVNPPPPPPPTAAPWQPNCIQGPVLSSADGWADPGRGARLASGARLSWLCLRIAVHHRMIGLRARRNGAVVVPRDCEATFLAAPSWAFAVGRDIVPGFAVECRWAALKACCGDGGWQIRARVVPLFSHPIPSHLSDND